jgi:predicted DNA-binding transcriptional regulator YafY
MNRIDRLVAILIHLQSKKVVTAHEIADRFEISQRTVYRDIRALEEAGIPIGAEAGVGYYIAPGYHLPPVMFSQNEAAALLTAEKMVDKFTDSSISQNYQSAMFKIKSVLPDKEKQYLDDLYSNIEVFHSSKSDFPNNYLSDVQFALANHRILTIDYRSFSKNEITYNRIVEPVGLCFYSMGWHLIGFCRMRKEYRDFRVDRIKQLKVNDEVFEKPEMLSVREYMGRLQVAEELIGVTLRIDKTIVPFINNVKYYYGYVGEIETNGKTEMDFVTNDLNYFSRWLLTFADAAEIVSPDKLKKLMQNLVTAINKKFSF